MWEAEEERGEEVCKEGEKDWVVMGDYRKEWRDG